MDAFERARPEIENPYGSNEEYLMYVSYDILNRVLGLPEAKTYLEAARAEGERRGQRTGRREARAQTAQAVREARQAGRAQVQEVRAQERARADERVQAAREAAAKRAERRAETEAKARLRRSIARKANNLIARLAKPTDARHIPEAMRKSVFEALRRINYTAEAPSIRHEAWQARIANLSNQINRYQDTLAEGGMDPALVADLNALVDEIDSTTRFDDMTSKQLEVLDDVFANLTRLVNEQDRLVSTRNRERAQKVADSAIQFLAGRRDRKNDWRAVDLITFDTMAAGDFFRTQLGEDAGGTLYQALRDGQDSTHAHMAQAAQDFAAMLKRRGIAYKDRQDWEKQIKAVKLKSGETIYARDTQLMTIYALSGREAGRRHLLSERGGIVLGRVRGTVDWQAHKRHAGAAHPADGGRFVHHCGCAIAQTARHCGRHGGIHELDHQRLGQPRVHGNVWLPKIHRRPLLAGASGPHGGAPNEPFGREQREDERGQAPRLYQGAE